MVDVAAAFASIPPPTLKRIWANTNKLKLDLDALSNASVCLALDTDEADLWPRALTYQCAPVLKHIAASESSRMYTVDDVRQLCSIPDALVHWYDLRCYKRITWTDTLDDDLLEQVYKLRHLGTHELVTKLALMYIDADKVAVLSEEPKWDPEFAMQTLATIAATRTKLNGAIDGDDDDGGDSDDDAVGDGVKGNVLRMVFKDFRLHAMQQVIRAQHNLDVIIRDERDTKRFEVRSGIWLQLAAIRISGTEKMYDEYIYGLMDGGIKYSVFTLAIASLDASQLSVKTRVRLYNVLHFSHQPKWVQRLVKAPGMSDFVCSHKLVPKDPDCILHILQHSPSVESIQYLWDKFDNIIYGDAEMLRCALVNVDVRGDVVWRIINSSC